MRLTSKILIAASFLITAPIFGTLPLHPWSQLTLGDTIKHFDSTMPPIRMNFVGDVMMARLYEQTGGIIPTNGVNAIFTPTLPFLGNSADITVANLECPLTNKGTPHPTKSIVFRGSPSNGTGLVYAGIDVVTIANNHILDYGLEGLKQTQEVLKSNNIVFSGAGANADEAYQPAFFTKSGVQFAFVAASDINGRKNNAQPFLDAGVNTPGFANLTSADLAGQIDTVRNRADLVVVEMHSGLEWAFAPVAADIQIRQFAIDHGADIVICHHTHTLEGFQVYKNKLIAHSLGNFAFDIDFPECMPTVILNASINGTGFGNYSVTPVFIDDFIPKRAKGDLGRHLLNYLARLSKDLGTYLDVDSEAVTASIIVDTLGLRPNVISHTSQVKVLQQGSDWVSEPLPLARSGSISSLSGITPSSSWKYRVGRDVIWFGNFEDEGCSLWNIDTTKSRYDTTTVHTGHRSLLQKNAAAAGTITTNIEKLLICDSTAAKFSLYGWIKTSKATSATMKLKFYNARMGGTEIGSTDAGTQIKGTADWTLCQREFTPTSGAKYLDMLLTSDLPANGGGCTWFDDVGIIAWSDWKTFDSSEVISTPNDYYWMQIKTSSQTASASVTYRETRYQDIYASIKNRRTLPPAQFQVLRNNPNSHQSMNISYTMTTPAEVTLNVYNILGQKVARLVDGAQTAGSHSVLWRPETQANGVYFYRLKTGTSDLSDKCIILHK